MFDSLVFRSSQDWILLTSTLEFLHWNFYSGRKYFSGIFFYIL